MCSVVKPPKTTSNVGESSIGETDDGGIEFTAKKHSPEPSPSQADSAHNNHPLAATESTLPWRRDSDVEASSAQVVRQEEFPPWIDNKDYLPYYASPTNTYLAKLSDQSKPKDHKDETNAGQSGRTPTVYEIFTIDESRENGDRSGSASSQGSRDTNDPKSVTRGRFQCTSASQTEAPAEPEPPVSPNVAINLGFESEDESEDKHTVYKL